MTLPYYDKLTPPEQTRVDHIIEDYMSGLLSYGETIDKAMFRGVPPTETVTLINNAATTSKEDE